jgi:hypothetical protein
MIDQHLLAQVVERSAHWYTSVRCTQRITPQPFNQQGQRHKRMTLS